MKRRNSNDCTEPAEASALATRPVKYYGGLVPPRPEKRKFAAYSFTTTTNSHFNTSHKENLNMTSIDQEIAATRAALFKCKWQRAAARGRHEAVVRHFKKRDSEAQRKLSKIGVLTCLGRFVSILEDKRTGVPPYVIRKEAVLSAALYSDYLLHKQQKLAQEKSKNETSWLRCAGTEVLQQHMHREMKLLDRIVCLKRDMEVMRMFHERLIQEQLTGIRVYKPLQEHDASIRDDLKINGKRNGLCSLKGAFDQGVKKFSGFLLRGLASIDNDEEGPQRVAFVAEVA